MCKRLVGFCHLMGIFFLLYGCARIIESIHQFSCQTFFHCTFAAQTGIVDHPADSQCQTAVCTNFNRHLVVGTADTTGTDFQNRHYIIQSLFENFDWVFVKLAAANIECTIYNGFCNALFAVEHNFIDETCNCLVSVDRIRQYITLRNSTFSRHC